MKFFNQAVRVLPGVFCKLEMHFSSTVLGADDIPIGQAGTTMTAMF